MAIILYARKSIENEVSISCETQLQYCRSMLRPHEQEEEILSIVDNGCSGGNMNREGFQQMMALVQAGKVSKVIVYKLDRFSRSFVDFANSMEIFRQHQVKFISSQEAFDTGSSYGEMVMQILMVFAQFERTSIIHRITQAYAHRSELGFYMGGNCPYGFQLVPTEIQGISTKKLQPLPSQAAVVQSIFRRYAEEPLSLRRLQSAVINEAAETYWTTSKLSSLLKNPIYVRADAEIYHYFHSRGVEIKGELSHFDGRFGAQLYGRSKHDPTLSDWSDMKLVLLSHEGLVDSAVWLRCQEKLAQNRQIRKAYGNESSWLAGRVFCKLCGHSMTIVKGSPRKSGPTRRYFSCTGKSHQKICSGPNVTIHAEELEDLLEASMLKKLSELEAPAPISEEHSHEINRLKLKITALEQEEQQLLDSVLAGDFNHALLSLANDKAEHLASERSELRRRLEALQNQSAPIPVDFARLWKSADCHQKKAAALLLIEKILIAENGSAQLFWNL